MECSTCHRNIIVTYTTQNLALCIQILAINQYPTTNVTPFNITPLFINFSNTISYFLRNSRATPTLTSARYTRYPSSVSKYFRPRVRYYFDIRKMKQYMWRMNH
jgi:hypothetical protein